MLLHNSYDPERETAAVTVYLDESGGDDPNTPHAVVGGLVVNRSHFQPFEDEWDALLDRHGIIPPLHMKEFGQHRRFGVMSVCCRRELFQEAAYIIDSHKVFSLDADLPNEPYRKHIPEPVRKIFSVYGMCFILSVVMNHKIAEANTPPYREKIAFVLDSGNPYAEHVRKAHAAILRFQRETYVNAGPLMFAEDKDFGVLQAADLIAWGARRLNSNNHFPDGFEPIAELLMPSKGHNHGAWNSGALNSLGNGMLRRIAALEDSSDSQ